MTLGSGQTRPYTHFPLSTARSIRVLDLDPSSSVKAPLKGSLRELHFPENNASPLPYEALSYVWGTKDANNPSFVYISAVSDPLKHLEVTPNCAAALRKLRLRDKKRTLWVDAICIDQTSNDEKKTQIPLMGELYAQAGRVAIWLDLRDISEIEWKRFLKFVKQVAWLLSRGLLRIEVNQKFQMSLSIMRLCEKYCIKRTKELSRILHTFLTNQYFQRVWTCQEFMLARKADAMVFSAYGNAPLKDVVNGISFSWRFGNSSMVSNAREHVALANNSSFFFALPDSSIFYDAAQLATGVSSRNMINTNNLQCSEPRDKAYAFMWALQEKAKQKNQDGLAIFQVDYQDKSVEQVYMEFSVAVTLLFDTKEALYSACQKRKKYTLPSWVMDWSSPRREQFDLFTVLDTYRAGASGKECMPLEFRGSSMFAHGILVTTVSRIFRLPKHPIFSRDFKNDTTGERFSQMEANISVYIRVFEHISMLAPSQPVLCHKYLKKLHDTCFRTPVKISATKIEAQLMRETGLPLNELYLRFLFKFVSVFTDYTDDEDDSMQARFLREETFMQTMIKTLEPILGIKQTKNYLEDILPLELPLVDHIIILNQHCRDAIRFAYVYFERLPDIETVFFTTDGRVGSGMDVQVGDTVAVWDGFEYPSILRRVESAADPSGPWALSSYALVSDLMAGEAYQEGSKHVRFEIR